ncbi:MAG TPA: cyclic-di-AMP receptor [Candidatus Sulfotelmatobacter sp.]|nr:cyclic-di-AMP receptor [Candidatus Sulfotelmatobacter sp.]HWI60568.1 cyclic-di-AMP receptor [Symbiobacteriaceae bacterium]
MKLIVAVIQDRDSVELTKRLTEAGHRSTKLASTGGFLRSGNTTMLIGTDEQLVDEVLAIIRTACKSREEMQPARSPAAATGEAFLPFPVQVVVGGATVFVLDVARFEKC